MCGSSQFAAISGIMAVMYCAVVIVTTAFLHLLGVSVDVAG